MTNNQHIKDRLLLQWRRFVDRPSATFALRHQEEPLPAGWQAQLSGLSKTIPAHRQAIFLNPPLGNSMNRLQQWQAGRVCLLEAVQALGLPNQISQLSLSHTRELSVAIAAPLEGLSGIGIDLESSERRISENVQQRFIDNREKNIFLKPIEIWVIKEACYKANPKNHETVLSDYRIVDWDNRIGAGVVTVDGDAVREIRFRLTSLDNFSLAFAVC